MYYLTARKIASLLRYKAEDYAFVKHVFSTKVKMLQGNLAFFQTACNVTVMK